MLLRDAQTHDIKYIKELYREAFPLRERMPFSTLERLQRKGKIRILTAIENSEPCAMAVTVSNSRTVLLLYLAVDGTKRGQGIGSKVISAFGYTFPRRRLLLEIEKPDKSKPLTVRRKEFYLRCGLRDTGVDIRLAGVPMELLIKGEGEFDPEEYLRLYEAHLGRGLTKLLLKIQ